MALQIANPRVVAKIEKLAKSRGLTKTAFVEMAVDRLALDSQPPVDSQRMRSLLVQFDGIPERVDAVDPLLWDENGLPR